MNSVANANFRTAKFHNLGNFAGCENFTTWEIPGKIWFHPALEHLQQHKTKNYEKIILKTRKFTKFEN